LGINTLRKGLFGDRIERYAKTNFPTKEAQTIARSRLFQAYVYKNRKNCSEKTTPQRPQNAFSLIVFDLQITVTIA